MSYQPGKINQPNKINQSGKYNQPSKNTQLVPSNSHEMKNKDEEVEEIKITKDKDNKNPRALTVPQNKINKEIELQNRIINLQNQVIESNPLGRDEIFYAFQKSKEDALEIPIIKMFYNNAFHIVKLKDIDDYEDHLNSLLPPLRWLKVSRVEKQYLTVHHKAGTEAILRFFMPYYDFSINTVRDEKKNLIATEARFINKKFPFYQTVHVSAPGKTDNIKGGEQARLTYSMKLSSAFGFLRTTTYENTLTNFNNLSNMFEVMNIFKNTLKGVDYAYEEMFRFSIDYIAHYYISRNIAPNRKYFNLEVLTKYFGMDKLKKGGYFYSKEDLNNHPELILDKNSELDMEEINEIMNDENLLIQDDIEDFTFAARRKKMKEELEQDYEKKISSFNEHLIPIDYFYFIQKLNRKIEILIERGILPFGSNSSLKNEEMINEMKKKKK